MTTFNVNNNYGPGSTHNFKKELEDFLTPEIVRQTRLDMQSEPSHDAIDREIQYRLTQEKTAIAKLSQEEAEVAFKQGMKATDYVHYRDN